MKALITSFGTDGDNNPFIALALAMRDRGDEPILLLNPHYAKKAAQLGLRFVPLGEGWHVDDIQGKQKYMHFLKGSAAIFEDFYLPRIAPTYRAVREAIEREQPDVVVSHFFSYGATWAARAAGVPDAVVTLAPCMWMSYDSPPIFSPFVPPMWSRGPLLWVFRAVVDSIFRKWLGGAAAQLALPPRRSWYFSNFDEAGINLALWSGAFTPPARDAPPRHVICGFPILRDSAPQPLTNELRAFLDNGPAPVVVGLGTSARDVGEPVYRAAAEACEELGERCLLIGPLATERLPSSAFVVRSAPYVPVFARARAIIHHGGVNTTAEALRAGVPSIVVPFAADQFDNAERVQLLGVGRMISRGRATSRTFAAGLRELLSPDVVERARLLGARLAAEGDGADRAVDALRSLVRGQAAVPNRAAASAP